MIQMDISGFANIPLRLTQFLKKFVNSRDLIIWGVADLISV